VLIASFWQHTFAKQYLGIKVSLVAEKNSFFGDFGEIGTNPKKADQYAAESQFFLKLSGHMS
jgi:hypothetical protein